MRRQLEMAEAMRMARAHEDDYRAWHSDLSRFTGPGEVIGDG
jgi:hypothetical protein